MIKISGNVVYLPASHQISDSELELHISACKGLVETHYGDYKRSGDMEDLTLANRYRCIMYQAIRFRSPAQIARMESDRGLI